MQRLTVLFDATCGFCVRVRWWLERQRAYVPLEFLQADGPEVLRRYPDLVRNREEMIAIDDAGGVYRSTDAYLLILWALEDWRGLALDLAAPALRPLARRAFAVLAGSRRGISWLFRLTPESLGACPERSSGQPNEAERAEEEPRADPTASAQRLLDRVQELRRS